MITLVIFGLLAPMGVHSLFFCVQGTCAPCPEAPFGCPLERDQYASEAECKLQCSSAANDGVGSFVVGNTNVVPPRQPPPIILPPPPPLEQTGANPSFVIDGPIVQSVKKYYCGSSNNQCVDCNGLSCPADIALFNNVQDCAARCPPSPDCYMCSNNKCVPGFGLACYGGPSDLVRYRTPEECSTTCSVSGPATPVQPSCQDTKHLDECFQGFFQKVPRGNGSPTNVFSGQQHAEINITCQAYQEFLQCAGPNGELPTCPFGRMDAFMRSMFGIVCNPSISESLYANRDCISTEFAAKSNQCERLLNQSQNAESADPCTALNLFGEVVDCTTQVVGLKCGPGAQQTLLLLQTEIQQSKDRICTVYGTIAPPAGRPAEPPIPAPLLPAGCDLQQSDKYHNCFNQLSSYAPFIDELDGTPFAAQNDKDPEKQFQLCTAYDNFKQCVEGVDHCRTRDPTHRFMRTTIGLICNQNVSRATYAHRQCLSEATNTTTSRTCFSIFSSTFDQAVNGIYSGQEKYYCDSVFAMQTYVSCTYPEIAAHCGANATEIPDAINAYLAQVQIKEGCATTTEPWNPIIDVAPIVQIPSQTPQCIQISAQANRIRDFCATTMLQFEDEVFAKPSNISATEKLQTQAKMCTAYFYFDQCQRIALEIDRPCGNFRPFVDEAITSVCNDTWAQVTGRKSCLSGLENNPEVMQCVQGAMPRFTTAFAEETNPDPSVSSDMECARNMLVDDMGVCLREPVVAHCGSEYDRYTNETFKTMRMAVDKCFAPVAEPAAEPEPGTANTTKSSNATAASSALPVCDTFDTIACLFPLANLAGTFSNVNGKTILRMPVDKPDAVREACATFDEYRKCVKDAERESKCRAVNPLDQFALSAADLFCNATLHELVREHVTCVDNQVRSPGFEECANGLKELISMETVGDLLEGRTTKICELVKALTDFNNCGLEVAEQVCSPQDMVLPIYFDGVIQKFASSNPCAPVSANASAEPVPEPSPTVTSTTLVQTTARPSGACVTRDDFAAANKCMDDNAVTNRITNTISVVVASYMMPRVCDTFVRLSNCLATVPCVPKQWNSTNLMLSYVCSRGQAAMDNYTAFGPCWDDLQTNGKLNSCANLLDPARVDLNDPKVADSVCLTGRSTVDCSYHVIGQSCGYDAAEYSRQLTQRYVDGFTSACVLSVPPITISGNATFQPLPEPEPTQTQAPNLSALLPAGPTIEITGPPLVVDNNLPRNFKLTLMLPDEIWTDDLKDAASGKRADITEKIRQAIDSTFGQTLAGYHGVDIVDFKQGSVHVELNLNVSDNTLERIQSFLQQELADGKIGNLSVHQSTWDLRESNIYSYSLQCSEALAARIRSCITPYESLGSDLQTVLSAGLTNLGDKVMPIMDKYCALYPTYSQCMKPVVESGGSCIAYSCLMDSTGETCGKREQASQALDCLVNRVIKDKRVLLCGLKIIQSAGGLNNLGGAGLVGILPQLSDCARQPLLDLCGENSSSIVMGMITPLSSVISAVNHTGCPITADSLMSNGGAAVAEPTPSVSATFSSTAQPTPQRLTTPPVPEPTPTTKPVAEPTTATKSGGMTPHVAPEPESTISSEPEPVVNITSTAVPKTTIPKKDETPQAQLPPSNAAEDHISTRGAVILMVCLLVMLFFIFDNYTDFALVCGGFAFMFAAPSAMIYLLRNFHESIPYLGEKLWSPFKEAEKNAQQRRTAEQKKAKAKTS